MYSSSHREEKTQLREALPIVRHALTIDGKTVFLRPLAGKLLIVAQLLGYKNGA